MLAEGSLLPARRATGTAGPARGGCLLQQAVVVTEGLGRHWSGVWAVRDVNLTVTAGEIFGIVGPDGAGKSTLLRMLGGSLPPHAGRAAVLGRAAGLAGRGSGGQGQPPRGSGGQGQPPRGAGGRVGYLSQGLGLYLDLTVAENLHFCAALYGVRDPAPRIAELLALTGLRGHEWKAAGALSGGMRQKLGLACALVHRPALVLLDEPTTGVDPVSRREFWRIMAGLQQAGTTFVISTPYMDEAGRCDRVAFLFAGRVLAADTPAGLRGSFPHVIYAAPVPGGEVLRAAGALAAALRRVGVTEPGSAAGSAVGAPDDRAPDDAAAEAPLLRVAGNSLRLYAVRGVTLAHLRALCARAGYPHLALRRVEPGLDDVFLHLLRAGGRSA